MRIAANVMQEKESLTTSLRQVLLLPMMLAQRHATSLVRHALVTPPTIVLCAMLDTTAQGLLAHFVQLDLAHRREPLLLLSAPFLATALALFVKMTPVPDV